MTMWRIPTARQGTILLLMVALASCVAAPQKPVARPAPPPAPPALPAAPPQQDWRDVPLTPGDWTWRGQPGQSSIAQFGVAGQGSVFALRCDLASRNIVFSRAGALAASSAALTFTSSFGAFALAAGNGGGQPPAIVAQLGARDPRLDQLAFSRGRFLVDAPGQTRLVLPAWPQVARVIEDCR
ncbi:hypothetical protein [Sphingomonas abietis]|uniref:Uncharacterized protein n=1 Tax=Sphingomonas abietis TaxID=3012344 RepID=A0ABY7NK77_9SPHN|nr:hypothetical protein [Sphingomonas abietis]WBO21007.1 hypothetical protein PBT88_12410 [Sphingomonas abietis]